MNRIHYTRQFYEPDLAPDSDPYCDIGAEPRDAIISKMDGTVIFKQTNVLAPTFWSDTAVQVVAQKYLRGKINADGTPAEGRETSVFQLIDRVVDTIGEWAGYWDQNPNGDTPELMLTGYGAKYKRPEGSFPLNKFAYFDCFQSWLDWKNDLKYLLINQYFCFNSPVWFNVGVESWPQCSACFLTRVEDTMEGEHGLFSAALKEGRIFRGGSGSGINLSRIRSSKEWLSGGGHPSGPMSFAKIWDVQASTVKSGGKTRRAAKMLIMDVDHPDIYEFLNIKAEEEKIAKALIAAGYPGDMDGDAYLHAFHQNSNLSVRLSTAFLEAVALDGDWNLISRSGHFLEDKPDHSTMIGINGKVLATVGASKLMEAICNQAWACGDPGIQFADTINAWHTCADTEPINTSNPCCLTGDVLVETSEGRIPISILVDRYNRGERLPHAFSWLNGKPVLREITRAWRAGSTKSLVRVITDKGIAITCTPEHRFMTFGGEWVQAKDLRGLSVRKIARNANKDRSGRISIGLGSDPEKSNGYEYQSRWMWLQTQGPIPEGYEVHHVNEDPTDDRLSNLTLIEKKEHLSLHSAGAANTTWIEVTEEELAIVYSAIAATPRGTHKNGPPVTPMRWNTYVKNNHLKGKIPLAQSITTGGYIHGLSWEAFEERMLELANDKIVSVEFVYLGETEVFDIEVAESRCFSVSSPGNLHGIIVHNSEYVFIDETSCNLGSFNLKKFFGPNQDINRFQDAVRAVTIAMDVIVSGAKYPTENIQLMSNKYRTLGVGYANLGGLLMSLGIPYNSDEGRNLAAAITSLMTARVYYTSAEIASEVTGPFIEFEKNRKSFAKVMGQHAMANSHLQSCATGVTYAIVSSADWYWDQVYKAVHTGKGVANAQATVLAPTGTIAFMMDCETTGIEPELGLIKYKTLAGKGTLSLPNPSLIPNLVFMGIDQKEAENIAQLIANGRSPRDVMSEPLAQVFRTSFPPNSDPLFCLPWEAHIQMMGAVQPFISGAISKTINMPSSATPEDIKRAYLMAHAEGLKAVAIYRDGSKGVQPVSTTKDEGQKASGPVTEKLIEDLKVTETRLSELESLLAGGGKSIRQKPDREVRHLRERFDIDGHKGYLFVGFYAGTSDPCEIFVFLSKTGSALQGFTNAFCICFSLLLQYGVPLEKLVDQFEHTEFEPKGIVPGDPDVKMCQSVLDYIVRKVQIVAGRAGRYHLVELDPDEELSEDIPKHLFEATHNLALPSTPSETVNPFFLRRSGRVCRCGSFDVQVIGKCMICRTCGSEEGGCFG